MTNPAVGTLKTAKALERQICRIHELIECSPVEVTWNDRIPDPDNPSQLRQIDITVRRETLLTIIECRTSKKRQDVKWIEELIGRRQSLDAQTVIAVASAGFTAGAQRKASRYGIVLRDLRQLSDTEIKSWTGQVGLVLHYYQYSEAKLVVGFGQQSLARLDPAPLRNELRSHAVVQSVFNAAAKYLGERKLLAQKDTQKFSFGVLIQPENIHLCGEPVLEIGIEGKACLVAQPVIAPWVFRYGEPTQASIQREITVERYMLGETSIIRQNDRISIDIDLSALELPPLSQVRYFSTTSAEELEYESFAITDPDKLRVAGYLPVRLYALKM